jgi:hypothetical protein
MTAAELDDAYSYISTTTKIVEGFSAKVFYTYLLKAAIRDQHCSTLSLLLSTQVFQSQSLSWFRCALRLGKETAASLFLYENVLDLGKAIEQLVSWDKLSLLSAAVHLTMIHPCDYTPALTLAITEEKEQIVSILLRNTRIGTSECLITAVRTGNHNIITMLLDHPNMCPNYNNTDAYEWAVHTKDYVIAEKIVKHCLFRVTDAQVFHAATTNSQLFETILTKRNTFNPKVVKYAIRSQNTVLIELICRYYAHTPEPLAGIICRYDFFPALDTLLELSRVSLDSVLILACRYGATCCINLLLTNTDHDFYDAIRVVRKEQPPHSPVNKLLTQRYPLTPRANLEPPLDRKRTRSI